MKWSYHTQLLRQAVFNFFGTQEWLELFKIILYQISFLSSLYLFFFVIWNFVWYSKARFNFTFAVQNKSFLIELLWYYILYASIAILSQLPVHIIYIIIELKLTPTKILIFMLQPHVLKIFVLTFILSHVIMFLILCINLDNIERNFLFFELLLIFKLLLTYILITLMEMHVEVLLKLKCKPPHQRSQPTSPTSGMSCSKQKPMSPLMWFLVVILKLIFLPDIMSWKT